MLSVGKSGILAFTLTLVMCTAERGVKRLLAAIGNGSPISWHLGTISFSLQVVLAAGDVLHGVPSESI